MRSRTTTRILLLVGLALLVFLGWGLYSSIEYYDDTEHTAGSIRAQRNPYLAAQLFMQESGINAVEADSLIGLNSLEGVATVLITDANQVVNPRQLEQVLNWLEKGGTLIVTANSFASSDDLLLEKFHVEVQWPDREESTDDDDDTQDDDASISESLRELNQQIEEGKTLEDIAQLKVDETSLTHIDFGDDTGVLEIAFNSYKILTHPYVEGEEVDDSIPQPFSWSSSDHGIHMMQFDVGEGLLSIISDPTIWTSSRVDNYDHAYLLWVLSSQAGDFAILHPALRDSIWKLMLDNLPELLIALALTIVFWLWYLGHRFGRIEPRDTSGGRALSEHFSATAHYLWHRKASDKLIEPVRQQILRRAAIVLPAFAGASKDPQAQLQLISQHCGIEVTSVDIALNAMEFNEASFVRTVKLLKYIEQSL